MLLGASVLDKNERLERTEIASWRPFGSSDDDVSEEE